MMESHSKCKPLLSYQTLGWKFPCWSQKAMEWLLNLFAIVRRWCMLAFSNRLDCHIFLWLIGFLSFYLLCIYMSLSGFLKQSKWFLVYFWNLQVPDALLEEAKAAAKAALEEMDADWEESSECLILSFSFLFNGQRIINGWRKMVGWWEGSLCDVKVIFWPGSRTFFYIFSSVSITSTLYHRFR